ncbi:MAG TPA: hypothetical protein VK028_12525 [Micromonosporaceae bacterium]|nr:hypothetical protein [Micromonosporaceae bacterium]
MAGNEAASRIRQRLVDDRGDNPVSTAIIVSVIAVAALAVAAAIKAATDSYIEDIPQGTP